MRSKTAPQECNKKDNAMKVHIDKDLCVGDRVCVKMCPELFDMDGEVAVLKTNTIPERLVDVCLNTAEMCPEFAIVIKEL
jgi:ferredoxin